MKAAVLSPPDAARPDYAVAAITEIPTPQPAKETDVQVKLKAAALNHRGASLSLFLCLGLFLTSANRLIKL